MKTLLATIAGVTCGFLVIFAGDAVTKSLYPMPMGLNYMDKNIIMDFIGHTPMPVLVVMSLFWLLSAFTGGLIGGLIASANWKRVGLNTGLILLAATLLNLIMTAPAHPLWMWIVGLVGCVPFSFLGAWLVNRQKPTTTSPQP